jgi:hypothetical protein
MNDMQISGIWDPQRAPDAKSFRFADRHLGLQFGNDVALQQDEQRLLLLDGELFDVTIADALRDRARLDQAFGYFAYVHHDKHSGETTIGTDRFGYFPMYYAFEEGRLVFGSTMDFVRSQLEHCSPDYDAWEDLLVLGEVLGERSTVKQIKRLLYGTRIAIRDGRVAFETFWTPEMPPPPMAEAEFIAENNRLLGQALVLTAGNAKRKVVLLSGGEDSRRIAVGAVKQQLPVDFYTQESIYRGSYTRCVDRDIKPAAKVAELLGRPHYSEALPTHAQFLANWQLRDTALGFECIAHEWLLPLARKIERPALIYDGIVGDITINGHYFKEFPAALDNYRNVDAMARMICGDRQSPWLDELRRHTETSLFERVRALLASYPESPHRLSYFFILNHTRRKISCASQLFRLQGHSTCYPFLYYPLFLQSLRIDPTLLLTKFYQRECMAAQMPEALSVPTTRGRIGNEWLLARGNEAQEQADCLLENLQVSDRALAMFPAFRRRYPLARALGRLGPLPLRKLGWFIPQVSRFSAFLDWLEQRPQA